MKKRLECGRIGEQLSKRKEIDDYAMRRTVCTGFWGIYL